MILRREKMRKLLMLGLLFAVSACAVSETKVKETYPYGMNEKEWNQLSIKDKAAIRRDFYFYEKGSTSFVNPKLEIEGRQDSNQSNKLKIRSRFNGILFYLPRTLFIASRKLFLFWRFVAINLPLNLLARFINPL